MDVLVGLLYYHPHWTGLTAYAKRLSEGLVARGHRVTVLTSRFRPDLPAEECVGGVRVLRLRTSARISRGVLMPGLPAAAAREIRRHDIVQIHTPMLEAALLSGLARAHGKPALVIHHGDLVMPRGPFNRAVQAATVAAMHAGLGLADRVVTHSADYARHSAFLAPHAHKLEAIYPPVELPPPDPAAVAAWRAELGLGGRPTVGFAGRFVEEKGFDYLLRAIPLVRERLPGAQFLFAGVTRVAYERFFERCAPLFAAQRHAISLLGLIEEPQRLANFYALCDVFALPSRTDCFPSVQIEAQLSGTPLVTADIPGAREVVRRTGRGLLVGPHSPRALADGLLAVLASPEAYRPARDEVRAVFDVGRTLDAYEALMDELLAPQPLAPAAPPLPAPPAGAMSLAPRSYTSLTPDDQATLARLLRNEADMAYRRRAPALLDHLDLREGDRVLDCGCGMGVYLMMMGQLRPLELYGVDGDRERLAWAEREGVPARLAAVDIHRLPFADGCFDKVLMSEVLEHLDDDRGALREIRRVLRPGGTLALSVPHADYPFWWDPINRTLELLGRQPIRAPGLITGIWSNHVRLYRPRGLAATIAAGGLRVEALEAQTHHAFPFIHFIVYSIGKPLIELNLLPAGMRDAADRFRGARNSGSLLNPINLGVSLLRRADAPNDRLRGDERSFVSLVARARRPLEPAPADKDAL